MKILTICGSLRPESSNRALLKALRLFFPNDTTWFDADIQTLPYFDPTLQFSETKLPASVSRMRADAGQSDLIVISTPEYAHGIPGVLKNSLEWLLCEETMKKKVAVMIGTPSGGEYVQEYLLETLKTMDFAVEAENSLVVRSARHQISADGKISDEALSVLIKSFADKLHAS